MLTSSESFLFDIADQLRYNAYALLIFGVDDRTCDLHSDGIVQIRQYDCGKQCVTGRVKSQIRDEIPVCVDFFPYYLVIGLLMQRAAS